MKNKMKTKSQRLIELALKKYPFKHGDRVRLKPDPEEGFAEEFGTVVGDEEDGTVCVELDKKYAADEFDDLHREVDVDQLELVKVSANKAIWPAPDSNRIS